MSREQFIHEVITTLKSLDVSTAERGYGLTKSDLDAEFNLIEFRRRKEGDYQISGIRHEETITYLNSLQSNFIHKYKKTRDNKSYRGFIKEEAAKQFVTQYSCS